tara:strand:+ start:761 stop:1336 length:576 start_codon:yes stop_codon:yes gene_type:complete
MKDLKDYMLHLKKWIPNYILTKTLKELTKEKNWTRHTYTNLQTLQKYSMNKNKELDVCWTNNLSYSKEIYDLVWKALEKYIITDNISGKTFTSWSGFSEIRFNKYKKGQIMSKHSDHIVSLFTGKNRGIPVLSIIGVLNDNYEGGEFIMFDDYEIKFKAGDILIFPSIFLYPHLVKPVKKGTRYSFVSWCY